MSVLGKNSLSFRKKDVQAQKSIGVGFKKIVFAHKATAGDTGINLASLAVPTEMSSLGFTNPSVADITSANLFFYRKNLVLVSSLRGTLVDYLAYSVGSSTRINFEGFTAEDGEIFIGTLDPVAKTELQVVDAAPLISTGTLAVGVTDYNVGTPFQINKYPLTQVGAVIVYRNGIQQFRNTNNGLTGGNYYEVSVGAGLGTVIRFNNAPSGVDDNILVVSNGLLAERPDGSMMAAIENIAGQLDQVIPTVAALAGVPETNFQTAPNNIDLKQFGDRVLDLEELTEDIDAEWGVTGTMTSQVFTPVGTAHFHQLVDNSFVLNPGTYKLHARALFSNGGISPGYTFGQTTVWASNGNNTGASPAAISTLGAAVEVLHAGPAPEIVWSGPLDGSGPQTTASSPLFLKINSPVTLYVVTYSQQTTSANARVTVYCTIERVKRA